MNDTNETPTSAAPKPDVAPAEAPVVTATETAPGAPAPKKSQTKLVIAIVSGILVLVVGVLLTIFLIAQNSVSKEDYRDSATQYNAVREAGRDLGSEVTSLSRLLVVSDDADFEEAAGDAEAAINALSEENRKLGETKAMRNGEGKEVYGAFNEKINGYTKYAQGLVDSVKALRPALLTCQEVASATGEADRLKSVRDCSSQLKSVSENVPNEQLKKYAVESSDNYAKFATAYETLQNSPTTSEEYRDARREVLDIQSDISRSASQLGRDIRAADVEAGPEDEANALRKFLNDKQAE